MSTVTDNRKLRDSNFELLRVVAILFVLILHADFMSLNGPDSVEIRHDTFDATICIFIQSFTIVAVNVFVMISGWYGIRPKIISLCNLIFQVAFYLILNYALFICIGLERLSFSGLKEIILATPSNWFVKAYVLLYILAPVLNIFAENASRPIFKQVLIGFFTFQTVYGLIFQSSTIYIDGGYSPLSFIGLYLLVRYVKIYKPRLSTCRIRTYAMYCIGMSILNTALCIVPILIFKSVNTIYGYNLLSYISPTVIIAALSLILLFSKIHLKSKFINRLGASSFAVYCVFVSPFILMTHYKEFFQQLYDNCIGLSYWGLTILICILLYLVVAVFDTLRIKLWYHISKHIPQNS